MKCYEMTKMYVYLTEYSTARTKMFSDQPQTLPKSVYGILIVI